ncbi:hypothetical protein FA13DRAFT_1711624 [Coprinellus micaceus]|uniref:Uncharacterized protein n=1 Tax=Coprinellus micaceus TaxID=71717 RepID=A0A4Y7T3Q4_COPMI|nr:hypothetical protein FA13DRAFT_1711624 [Coprinellus micaceus]
MCPKVDRKIVAFYCLYVYYVFETMAEEVGSLLTLAAPFRDAWIELLFDIPNGLQGTSYHIYHTVSPTWLEQLSAPLLIWRATGSFLAEPVSLLDAELGYPCYLPSTESWMEKTIIYIGVNIRVYMNLVATTSIRMVAAVMRTPTVILAFGDVRTTANYVIIPILAQHLLINMRKVDYMGSEPIASKLLFAPPAPASEDDLEGDFDSLEMTQGPSGLRQGGSAG